MEKQDEEEERDGQNKVRREKKTERVKSDRGHYTAPLSNSKCLYINIVTLGSIGIRYYAHIYT